MTNNEAISRIMPRIARRSLIGRLLPVLGAVAALLIHAAPAHAYYRGVNMSGMEFNGGTLPGSLNVDFPENSDADYNYFGGKGLNLMRVPFLWERVQPTLNGSLDPTYLGYIKDNVNWAINHNCKVILDVHNYGAYRGGGIDVSGSGVTSANLVDLWTKLSTQFKGSAGVYAYDLMNEPANANSSTWHGVEQSVVNAIRNNGDTTLLMVPGNGWESAGSYSSDNGATGWITDSANNFKYSAHMYFDHDNSGTYGWTYATELANNSNLLQIGVQRFDVFKNWCTTNGVQGYIGEFGCPNNDSTNWYTVMNNFYNDLDSAGFDGTYWAAGDWWGTYPLSCEPTSNFTVDAGQIPTITAHKGAAWSTGTSGPVKIDCGGAAATPFIADADFSGGTAATNNTGTVDTSAVTNPAPVAVYQSERWGAMTYTAGGLTANGSYTVRLHFTEDYCSGSGQRQFNVAINGTTVLTNFDIYAAAGAQHKANIQQFNATANGSGQVIIAFSVGAIQNPKVDGIEVNAAGSAPSAPTGLTATAGNSQVSLSWNASTGATAYDVKRSTVSGSGYATVSSPTTTSYTNTGLTNGTTYYFVVDAKNANGTSGNSAQASATPNAGTSGLIKINAGGPAASPFVADADFSGGTAATNWTGSIDTSAVTSPAPQAVYQSERWGAMTYTMGGLTSGTSYTVRLHFCENYFTASGLRKFNVAINGTTVLTNYDIYATAGAAHKANVQQFTAAANGSGQIVVAFSVGAANNPLVNGIEINPASGGTTINYGSGFTGSGMQLNGNAVYNGSRLRLTNGTSNQLSSAFYPTKVNVGSFNTTFNFQLSSGGGTGDGITFCIQNNAATSIGGGGSGLGYQGITNSAAIKFDLFTDGGEGANPTQLYTGGVYPGTPSLDMSSSNINLHSGDTFSVNLSYNGTTLTEKVTDTVTNAVYTTSYTVNIPTAVGASTAYVGFTGSSGGATAVQEILNWTY